MEYNEITTEQATPVSVADTGPVELVTAGLPAHLQTAHCYAPALGRVVGKVSSIQINTDAAAASSRGIRL